MKVKLLKKMRKRFKWKYLGEIEYMKRITRLFWQVIDLKNGTEIEQWEHACHLGIGNLIIIYSPTIAERFAIEMLGTQYVYHHRQDKLRRKNKSLNIRYNENQPTI